MTTTIAALALVTAYGAAIASPPSFFHAAAEIVAPASGVDIGDRREIIMPPSDIDPGMSMMPPHTGARMPVIAPPDVSGSRFGIER